MPLPIIVFAAAQATGEVASTSIWIYLGGTALGGGIYCYRDRIYNWWFPQSREVICVNHANMKQISGIQEAQNSYEIARTKFEKISETKTTILQNVTQSVDKTNSLIMEMHDLALVEKETFESLLKKITDGQVNKLDSILSALEKTKDSLTFDELGTIESILNLVKENQLFREVDAKKDHIIFKLEKINTILKEKLIACEMELKQEKKTSAINSLNDR